MRLSPKKEKKTAKFRISFVLLFIIASFLGCFTLYMKQDQPESYYHKSDNDILSDDTEAPADITEAAASENINPLPESSRMEGSYLQSCLFIGEGAIKAAAFGFISEEDIISDSIISNDNGSYFNTEVISEMIAEKAPAAVYIFTDPDPDSISLESYERLFEELSSFSDNTGIYVISAAPRCERGDSEQTDRFNSELLSACSRMGIYYLDTNTSLKNSSGCLESSYHDDGIPNARLYGAVTEYILTHTVS